jgi:lysine 2,3-aminomutase
MTKASAPARLTSPADFTSYPPPQGAYDLNAIEDVAARYAVAITPHVLSTVKGDPATDPVALQYLPQTAELTTQPEELSDPIGDHTHSPVKGIVHRYADRVLFKAIHVCAVYCRFCFRREMVGPGSDALSPEDRRKALDYIRANASIWEVILTGGDPLVLSHRQLQALLDELKQIDHVRVVRIHTRVPVADPAKITPEILQVLENFSEHSGKALYMAVHVNHAQELSSHVKDILKLLHKAGCVLVSQSVLLKGINDTANALENLFRALVEARVKPYYLHHPDLAPGTSHFRTSLKHGQDLLKDLQGRLSGLCLPHYMLDIPGGHGKIPVGPSYLTQVSEDSYLATDHHGNTHHYPLIKTDHDLKND